jgi:hypothetical protein
MRQHRREAKSLKRSALNFARSWLELHPEQGVPLALVKMAADRLADPEVDECWCIFDVEWPKNHPHLFDALTIVSSPNSSPPPKPKA